MTAKCFIFYESSPDGRGGESIEVLEVFLKKDLAEDKLLDLRCCRDYLENGYDYWYEEATINE